MSRQMWKLALILLAIAPSAHAQGWAHTWGGGANDSTMAIGRDASGNLYTAGSTSSFGAGGSDVLLLKYDPAGNLLWSRTWGGPSNEYAYAVAVDSTGSVYITGGTQSFGAGWYDVFLLKFDNSGNLLWSKTWGGGSYDVGYAIAFDPSGNICVAAESYSLGNAAMLLKFDSSGNLVSLRSWNGPATYDSAYSITIDASGNTYLAGVSWDYSVFPDRETILLLKYDSLGNLVWSKNWGGAIRDMAWGSNVIREDGAGNIYVAARTASFGAGDWDTMVLKFDANGNPQWAQTWGGTGYDSGTSLAFDNAGGLIVSAQTQSFNGGLSSALLLKYSPGGQLQASEIWNSSGNSSAASLVLDPNSNVIVGGFASNATGSWQPVVGTPGSASVAIATPSGAVGSSGGTVSSPTGAVGVPSGVQDAGSGGQDVFLSMVPASILSYPPPVTHTLTVSSTNPGSGVAITVSPLDNNNLSDDITQFTRTYNASVTVTLGAPATVGGNNFSSWTGCDSTVGANCTVTMSADRIVIANYVTPPPPPPPPPPPGTADFQWPVSSPSFPSRNDFGQYNAVGTPVGNHMFHTGIDLVTGLKTDSTYSTTVYATADGDHVSNVYIAKDPNTPEVARCSVDTNNGNLLTVSDDFAKVAKPAEGSHGLGNAVVIHHSNGKYSLYGHLDCVAPDIIEGQGVTKGHPIGIMGSSTIVQRTSPGDVHLHFEIKDQPDVGEAAVGGTCDPARRDSCYWGYTPDVPSGFGYHDPRLYIPPAPQGISIVPTAIKVATSTLIVRSGPGTNFALLTTISAGQEFVASAQSGNWYRIDLPNVSAPVTGWVAASDSGQILATVDQNATQIQIPSPASGNLGLTIGPSALSTTSYAGWDNTYSKAFGVPICRETRVWSGQRYVIAGVQSGWIEIHLPINHYQNSTSCIMPTSAAGVQDPVGPPTGWLAAVNISGKIPGPLFKDSAGNWLATVTVTNKGNVTVDSAQVKAAGTALGSTAPLSLPGAITNLTPGASATITITFPASAVAAGATSAPLRISGSYTAGTLSGNWSLTFRSVTLSGGVPLT